MRTYGLCRHLQVRASRGFSAKETRQNCISLDDAATYPTIGSSTASLPSVVGARDTSARRPKMSFSWSMTTARRLKNEDSSSFSGGGLEGFYSKESAVVVDGRVRARTVSGDAFGVEGAEASLRKDTCQRWATCIDTETYSTIGSLGVSLRGASGARAISARRLKTSLSWSMASARR